MKLWGLLFMLGCARAEPVGTVFYCSDGSCELSCPRERCVTQARAACAWFRSGSTFMCYPDPESCEEAREGLRTLGPCELKSPQELLAR